MATVDLFVLAAPWATLGLGVWAGIRIERRRRDRELDALIGRGNRSGE